MISIRTIILIASILVILTEQSPESDKPLDHPDDPQNTRSKPGGTGSGKSINSASGHSTSSSDYIYDSDNYSDSGQTTSEAGLFPSLWTWVKKRFPGSKDSEYERLRGSETSESECKGHKCEEQHRRGKHFELILKKKVMVVNGKVDYRIVDEHHLEKPGFVQDNEQVEHLELGSEKLKRKITNMNKCMNKYILKTVEMADKVGAEVFREASDLESHLEFHTKLFFGYLDDMPEVNGKKKDGPREHLRLGIRRYLLVPSAKINQLTRDSTTISYVKVEMPALYVGEMPSNVVALKNQTEEINECFKEMLEIAKLTTRVGKALMNDWFFTKYFYMSVFALETSLDLVVRPTVEKNQSQSDGVNVENEHGPIVHHGDQSEQSKHTKSTDIAIDGSESAHGGKYGIGGHEQEENSGYGYSESGPDAHHHELLEAAAPHHPQHHDAIESK